MNMIQTTVRFRRLILAFALLAFAVCALPAAAAEGKVNVNTASAEQLALLPRVGPAVAQRILEYREENGKLEAIEDLMLVRGIGEKTFELIAPHATLSGETTLSEKVRVSRVTDAGDGGGDEAAPSN
jgi:competence protein ComEA